MMDIGEDDLREDLVYCGPGKGCGIRLVHMPSGVSAWQPPPINDAHEVRVRLLKEIMEGLAKKTD
jgi:hypothetical protein